MILLEIPVVNLFISIIGMSSEDISTSLRLLARIIAEKYLRSSGDNVINKKKSQDNGDTQDLDNDDKGNNGEVIRL
jgi:hypothetical protein